MRFSLGTTSIDTEVIEGTETTNIRLGNVWYEGRDAIPDYKDPFYDIAQQAVEDRDGFGHLSDLIPHRFQISNGQ